ncbi:hypothetical protein Q4567_10820 [Aliiglaciecola sp. 2_MG-2023]|uniref:hypothetical protein n=1 Tax=Alteromonadaceae TaxID=72275 RepID=UPI0026E38C86|nr:MULTISPECIES: hypothetical protein [unclassified Aliiglaciecola]MDO6711216.1 hypothetical protein [Aliiglaciecola sp. 2_MG-2023]MDO6752130.1 hypothetical protein [Aliiglaciecola sp. 1_MG-2023]
MDMSFKEKSHWISLVSTICIFGYYFYSIVMLTGIPIEEAKESAKDLLIQAIGLSVLVEIVLHSMLAATNHKAAEMGADERDKLFEYRGNQVGYTILVVGVVFTLGRIITVEYNPEFADHYSSMQIPLLTAHILMFSFILSEVARFSVTLFNYRRGY